MKAINKNSEQSAQISMKLDDSRFPIKYGCTKQLPSVMFKLLRFLNMCEPLVTHPTRGQDSQS